MTSFWHELPRPFFVLAPMEAVTDVVFRHVVAQAAPPDIYFTEFTNATGWVHAGDNAIGSRLIKTNDERPIVAQIWGSVPDDIAALAKHCQELGFDGIDINMGCPDSHAIKSGGGIKLCQTPGLAGELIAAARTSGLPVSVKTRLGYSRTDEWQEWLSFLLRQDIANLTIHLRTKKEMSKVDAHHELIPEIKKLRDEIAPQTLLTINGDIRDRVHGLELVEQYGVDGIMIGRGIFHNPFAFEDINETVSDQAKHLQPEFVEASGPSPEPGAKPLSAVTVPDRERLIELLNLQLDLHDQWNMPEHPRKFDPLKRFFKIYIRDFEGAAELRDQLMHTKNTDEVREVLKLKYD